MEILPTWMHSLVNQPWLQWRDDTIQFATVNYQFIGGVAFAIVIITIARGMDKLNAYRHHNKILSIRKSTRERWMTTPEQENVERVLIADVVTDGLEELEYQGKMTRERVIVWYRRFGNLLNLPDLLEKHEVLLKEQLRKKHRGNKEPVKVIPFPADNNGKRPNRLLQQLRG